MKIFSKKKRTLLHRIIIYTVWAIIFFVITGLTFIIIHNQFKGFGFTLGFLSLNVILILCALFILYVLFDAARLYFILKAMHLHIRLSYLLKLVFINSFVSNVTPFSTGGGFAQIYFISRKGVSFGSTTAAITIRTILSILIIFTLTPIILLKNKILKTILPSGILTYAVILIFIYVSVFYIIVHKNHLIKRILHSAIKLLKRYRIISKKRRKMWTRYVNKEIESLSLGVKGFTKGKSNYIVLAAATSILFFITRFTFAVVLVRSVTDSIPILTIYSFSLLLLFISYFAPTPGASGVSEGGFAFIISKFVNSIYVLPLTFLWRAFTIYLEMIPGALFFYTEIFKDYLKRKRR